MNAMSPPFYGRTYPSQSVPMPWETAQALQNALHDTVRDVHRVLDLAMSYPEALDTSREAYNNAIADRDKAYRRLQDASAKLEQVERVVSRYAEVKDPVVASDGYTYERADLRQYLNDCKASNSKAYSEQTKEELTDVMVENVSLRRLAELLKDIHAVEVPKLSNRTPLMSTGAGAEGARSRWADEEPSTGGMPHHEMGPGHIDPIGGVGARGTNGMGPGAGHAAHRLDRGGKFGKPSNSSGSKNGLHPCLRVYGLCNFEDDCTFANYPYEACLNYIKGKCRFGDACKELHVDPRDPAFQNPRSYANHSHHPGGGGGGVGFGDSANNSQTADALAEVPRANSNKLSDPAGEKESEIVAGTKDGKA